LQNVEIADPIRNKQLRAALQHLGEESAIQVSKPIGGGSLLLGAVGTLQFEMVLQLLESEYGVDCVLWTILNTISGRIMNAIPD